MPIYLQKSNAENGLCVLRNLLSVLNISVSSSSLSNVKNDPSYPSLDALSNALFNWNISNLAVHLAAHQLHEIPYPAIAHLQKNRGHFVVLQKLDGHQIHFIDSEIGFVVSDIGDFEKAWSGAALLVEANEKSGEEGYAHKRKQEIFEGISLYGSIILLTALWAVPFTFLSRPEIFTYVLNGMGCILSLLLIQKQFGMTNAVIDSFCQRGAKPQYKFSINLETITESMNFNSCLCKKVSIDKDGFIKKLSYNGQAFWEHRLC